MRVLIVCDSDSWAIAQLAKVKIKYNPHINFRYEVFHPRDISADIEISDRFIDIVNEFKPDIIHFEYFRTAVLLLEKKPELKEYKILLTHHNQKDRALGAMDWCANGVDYIVTHTTKCRKKLIEDFKQPADKVIVINHGIDFDYFTYSEKEKEEKTIGYVGRIVPWKGLKEIAWCAKELGYKVQFMGKADKPEYWKGIVNDGLESVIDMTYYDCPDLDKINAYRDMTIYVGNSEDGLEEGPLGLLEAMACGVPVITTNTGIACDIIVDEVNGLIVPFGDKDALKNNIKRLMDDYVLRQSLRSKAWDTVKNMTDKKMAYEYSNLYYKLNNNTDDLVSIIIPFTKDRIWQVNEALGKINEQDYRNFEVILANDSTKDLSEIISTWREMFDFPIKYIKTDNDGYGLAQARNMSVSEAEGKYLLFMDSRLHIQEDAIQTFINTVELNGGTLWCFGNKGFTKKSFVENFSFVSREQFINFGMFNERINAYGGMSQEVRTRWFNQGGTFLFVEDAMAVEMMKASKNEERRKQIVDMKLLLFKLYKNKAK